MSNNYRGLVFSKYKSITDFAKEIGWTRNKASRVVNGIQKPTASDMEQMADVLNIKTESQFVSIFFKSLPIKWTSDSKAS